MNNYLLILKKTKLGILSIEESTEVDIKKKKNYLSCMHNGHKIYFDIANLKKMSINQIKNLIKTKQITFLNKILKSNKEKWDLKNLDLWPSIVKQVKKEKRRNIFLFDLLGTLKKNYSFINKIINNQFNIRENNFKKILAYINKQYRYAIENNKIAIFDSNVENKLEQDSNQINVGGYLNKVNENINEINQFFKTSKKRIYIIF